MLKRRLAGFLFFILIQIIASSQSVTVLSPRFVDNGDDTVTDRLTGLMWEQSPPDRQLKWTEAISYGKDLQLAGYSDWRLPYRNELRSLTQDERPSHAAWLNSQGFRNVQPVEYWSGSYFDYLGFDYAWVVHLRHGSARSNYQAEAFQVLFVRGGPWYGGP
jgi:hypothetical protein